MYAKVKPKTCVSLEGLFVEKKIRKASNDYFEKVFCQAFLRKKEKHRIKNCLFNKKAKEISGN
jgi:hypothetical protein